MANTSKVSFIPKIKNGQYYCRAINGVLDKNKNQVFCGKGCPCYQEENMEISCCCENDISNELSQLEPEDFKNQMDKYIENGMAPRFPDIYDYDSTVLKAYKMAAEAHSKQMRKSTKIPYMVHLIRTAEFANQLTDDRDTIIAAILHDTVEDTSITIEDIEREFGKSIADIVAFESEDKMEGIPKSESWQVRKERKLKEMETAPLSAKIVALCDKTSNIESLLYDYEKVGDDIWQYFNQKDKKKHEWYYRTFYNILCEFKDSPVMKRYEECLEKIFGK